LDKACPEIGLSKIMEDWLLQADRFSNNFAPETDAGGHPGGPADTRFGLKVRPKG
jgi:hypothetical protein